MEFQEHLQAFLDKRTLVYEPVQKLPPITTINEYSFIGSWSITQTVIKHKIILRDISMKFDNHYLTPSEIARIYLGYKFMDRNKRMRASQADSIWKHRHAPLFAVSGHWGDCGYIDIASAYFSIMSIVGWDIDYNPFHWLRLGRSIDDFPYKTNKLARNCLLSNSLPTVLSVWTGNFYFRKFAYNANLNLVLWAFVQDVLNGIACDMRKLGAYYIHTDGYIVDWNKHRQAMEIIESWGLRSTIKHRGDTVIHGIGSYEIGDYKTKRLTGRAGGSTDNIDYNEWRWLRERLYKASSVYHDNNYLDSKWLGR